MSDPEITPREIRVLLIEDDPDDAFLLGQELRRNGIPFVARRVENGEGFVQELAAEMPDVILSDHGLPQFDGFKALAIAQEKCPDVPFLFVTGSLGEEVIIETLRNGATDYVLKHQLTKLAPAIERALREADERRRRKAAEAERERLIHELQDALAKVKTLSGLLPICSSCKKIRDDKGYWSRVEIFLSEHSAARLTHGICPDCAERLYPGLTTHSSQASP
jgi:DNA-binding NtrC family response regulator